MLGFCRTSLPGHIGKDSYRGRIKGGNLSRALVHSRHSSTEDDFSYFLQEGRFIIGTSEVFTLGTADTRGRRIPGRGGCPVHHRMSRSIPGLHPRDTSISSLPRSNKKDTIHTWGAKICQLPPPPTLGLMLHDKLLLIFMKRLNAFWCQKKI